MRFLLFSYIFNIIAGSPINYDPYNLYSEAFTIEPDQPEQPNVPETQTPPQSTVALGNEDTTSKTDFNFIDNSLAGQNDVPPDVTSNEVLQFSTQPDSTSLIAKKPPVAKCHMQVIAIEIPCWVANGVDPQIWAMLAGAAFMEILTISIRKHNEATRKAIADIEASTPPPTPPKPPNRPMRLRKPPNPIDAELAREFQEAIDKFKLKKQKLAEDEEPNTDDEKKDDEPDSPDVKNFQKYIQFLDTNDHVWFRKTVEDSLVESGKARRDEGLAKTALLCINALEVVGPWLLLF